MLVEFTVGNYRSIKEPVTLSMNASSLKEHKQDNAFAIAAGKYSLLRSAIIYGANASGKSNIIKAMYTMKNIIQNSSRESMAGEKLPLIPFLLSAESESKNSLFEIIFFYKERIFRYGFEADEDSIHREWLYYRKRKEIKIFEREDDFITIGKDFSDAKQLITKTRKNALFFSVAVQFNVQLAAEIYEWFANFNVISGLRDQEYFHVSLSMIERPEHREDILTFIKDADLSIEDLMVEEKQMPKGGFPLFKIMPPELQEKLKRSDELRLMTIQSLHNKYDKNLKATSLVKWDFNEFESEGTQQIFLLSGPLVDTLKKGKTLVIDELDSRLHPLILRSIIRKFNSADNRMNAQLICVSHSIDILSREFFRRDQIWFTEKNPVEATELYSLAEFKVRNDATYRKDYMLGKYGSIPYIRETPSINKEMQWGREAAEGLQGR